MSPRNLDDSTCKEAVFSTGSDDSPDFTANLLHKKHKVIKLVKEQLLTLQEEGLLNQR